MEAVIGISFQSYRFWVQMPTVSLASLVFFNSAKKPLAQETSCAYTDKGIQGPVKLLWVKNTNFVREDFRTLGPWPLFYKMNFNFVPEKEPYAMRNIRKYNAYEEFLVYSSMNANGLSFPHESLTLRSYFKATLVHVHVACGRVCTSISSMKTGLQYWRKCWDRKYPTIIKLGVNTADAWPTALTCNVLCSLSCFFKYSLMSSSGKSRENSSSKAGSGACKAKTEPFTV